MLYEGQVDDGDDTVHIKLNNHLDICLIRDHCILGQTFSTLSPPISDAFDNIENFFFIKQMIQL